MKARYFYPLVFLLPCLAVSAAVGVFVVIAGAAIFWLFVFGDDTWPNAAEPFLMMVALLAAVGTFAGLMWGLHAFGKWREARHRRPMSSRA